ncbi:MAG TPA: hypothetical protein VLE53_13645, partial [Gemmatimonadaceae bacterium]|nr:hypothetical protein [Gemmatimonadaceae bacterium]
MSEARAGTPDFQERLATADALRLANRPGEAAAILNDLRREDPFHPRVMAGLGLIAADAGDHSLAESIFRECRHLAPDDVQVMLCEATAASNQLALDRALVILRSAVERHPASLPARLALAQMQHMLGAAAAEPEFARALRLDVSPGAEGGEQRALYRVAAGDPGGWAEFTQHWRQRYAAMLGRHTWWMGERDPALTVCVVAYGGIGDTVLFARFLTHVAERVGRTLVWAPLVLVRLLAGVEGVAGCVESLEEIPPDA